MDDFDPVAYRGYWRNHDSHLLSYRDKFRCDGCKRSLEDGERHNSNTKLCKACVVWSTVINRNDKYEYAGDRFVRDTFLDFYGFRSDRRCSYCGVMENDFWKIGLRNFRGSPIKTMGVDRKISRYSYSPSNCCLCCFECNRIKSDIISYEDMVSVVGPALRVVIDNRLVGTGLFLL